MSGHTHKNDDAESSVIGVILMVALVVILAAVIGAFVFGLPGNVQKGRVVAATATGGSNITVTYHGGKDASQVSNLSVTVDGADYGEIPTYVGFSGSAPPPDSSLATHHVIIVATFYDGVKQVILDTNVPGNSTINTTTVTPTPTMGPPLILSNVSSWYGAPLVGVICDKEIASPSAVGFTLTGGSPNNLIGTAWIASYGGGVNNVLVLDMNPGWDPYGTPLILSYTTPPGNITSQDGGALAGFSETVRMLGT